MSLCRNKLEIYTHKELKQLLRVFEMLRIHLSKYKLSNKKHFEKTSLCSIMLNYFNHEQITFENYQLSIIYLSNNKPFTLNCLLRHSWFWKPALIAPRLRYVKRQINRINHEIEKRNSAFDFYHNGPEDA
jgi:hypothetical protein